MLNNNYDVISDLLCGYVTVAPVATSSYQPSFYQAIHVPTMIVYGENDRGLGVTSAQHLSVIPSSTLPQILPNARHPAYLDEPAHWHQLLYNFMLHLIC
jgi:pimeloyl-ACP methyl ester carboxylesterase